MRFFISYSRADRFFVDHFVPLLLPVYGQDSVWFDEQIPGGADWWNLILEEIDKCDIFLMLMSNDSLNSTYCQGECRHALRLGKPILPIVVRPKTDVWEHMAPDLAAELRKINYIDLSTGFNNTKSVTSLYGSINSLAEKITFSAHASKTPEINDVNDAIAAFFKANAAQNWESARDALNTVRKFADIPAFFNVDEYFDLLHQHEQRGQQYAALCILIQHESPARAAAAIAGFQSRFPDYDPEGLFDPFRPPNERKHLEVVDILPSPFEWCVMSAGVVVLADASDANPPGTPGGQFEVSAFAIAKYPITNAQFQAFLDANDGYHDPKWWDYSLAASRWRADNPSARDTAFPGDMLPRTNVCWYDAVAFCQWLSHKTGQPITLPTEHQWQRAAQGDDNRLYPWGSEFDPKRCNIRSRGVTPVTQYPDGASPFGVCDMIGNVLEWCLNEWSSGETGLDNGSRRVLRGGSWHRTHQDELNVTYRLWNSADFRVDNRGFRIVRLY